MATASVSVRGTPENPIFDIVLPEGPKGEPGGWTVGTNLGTTDLDTITTPGLYWNGSTANALNPALHYPPMADSSNQGTPRGVLRVQSWSGGTAVVQTYTRINSGGDTLTQRPRVTYERYKGGTWSEWSMVTATKFAADAHGSRVLQTWDDETTSWFSHGPGGQPDPIILSPTLDLNTLTASGSYSHGVAVTTAQNYPVSATAGFVVVKRVNNNPGLVHQEWTPFAHDKGLNLWNRGHYVRMLNSATWSPWRFISTQRVDNSAGRAIFTWDDVANREQMVYGDTGWRNIVDSLLADNFSLTDTVGRCQIRRINNQVHLVLRIRASDILHAKNASKNATLLTLLDVPAGFRESPSTYGTPFTAGAQLGSYMEILAFGGVNTNAQLKIQGSSATNWRSNEIITASVSWPAEATWPVELPGIPG